MKQRPQLIGNPQIAIYKSLGKRALNLKRAQVPTTNILHTQLISQAKRVPNVLPIQTVQSFPTAQASIIVFRALSSASNKGFFKFSSGVWSTIILPDFFQIDNSADVEQLIKRGNSFWMCEGGFDGTSGIFRSDDGLITWNRTLDPTNVPFVSGEAVDVSQDGTVWALDNGSHVWNSLDNGNTWTEIFETALGFAGNPHGIVCHPTDANKLAFLLASGFGYSTYASDDTGASWIQTVLPTISFDDTHDYTEDRSQIVYTKTGRLVILYFPTDVDSNALVNISYSDDPVGGSFTTQTIETFFVLNFIGPTILKTDPTTGFLYALVNVDWGYYPTDSIRVWKSEDDGVTWSVVPSPGTYPLVGNAILYDPIAKELWVSMYDATTYSGFGSCIFALKDGESVWNDRTGNLADLLGGLPSASTSEDCLVLL